jgi:hypothetical protein
MPRNGFGSKYVCAVCVYVHLSIYYNKVRVYVFCVCVFLSASAPAAEVGEPSCGDRLTYMKKKQRG